MTRAASGTSGIENAYRLALRDFLLDGGGESALLQALEVGRAALGSGLSVLDLASLHRAAMLDCVLEQLLSDTAKELLARGDEVLAQSLVPYEMTHRGFADANARLQALNEELEQRVAERTSQLERVNQELEAFTYTVSHDLRAPLRAMEGFSRILVEEHTPQLSDEARHYLQRVRSNALRMSQLVDDLLAFSRLGRQPLQVRVVDPAAVVAEVLDDIRPELTQRRVAISIAELPPCRADPALLKQVYANLLGNAVKYTRGRENATIAVGCLPAGAAGAAGNEEEGLGPAAVRTYFVRDNGVGFDMAYAGKLFGVFQRLHLAEEFEGTGVGLAIVQRIVHRHGGRVWAESAPGEGATFYFTLPVEPLAPLAPSPEEEGAQ